MLYGEVYADEIDTCGDDAWDSHLENNTSVNIGESSGLACVTGYWIPPVLMTFFLLIANILLMSMLIAIFKWVLHRVFTVSVLSVINDIYTHFSHIFDQTDEVAQQIWLFQRYRQVMEYESTPIFPPPLTPISHIRMVFKYIAWKCNMSELDGLERKRNVFDFSLSWWHQIIR